jgi:hypothetical protein
LIYCDVACRHFRFDDGSVIYYTSFAIARPADYADVIDTATYRHARLSLVSLLIAMMSRRQQER